MMSMSSQPFFAVYLIMLFNVFLFFGSILWLQHFYSSCGSMIGYLLMLKERWENCKDPEKEIVQKLWRLYSQHAPLNSFLATFLFFLCTS